MKRIRKKLNSRKGASITYALLIFLVCAVVGSAVLVAGTAASGRMSKIAENDQRYYAVTSAARMIIDQIDGVPVTIVEEHINGGTANYKDEDGNSFVYTDSIIKEAVYYIHTSSRTEDTITLTLNAKDATTNTDIAALKVDITEKIETDGSMKLTLSNMTPGSSQIYSLVLLFNLDKGEPVETTEDDGTNITTTTTTIYTWHLRNIQVAGSQRWM